MTALVLVPSDTQATRSSQLQTATSQKRHRQEFVPGEALVRFKQNRAFEGSQSLSVPRNDTAVAGRDLHPIPSGDEMVVSIERFEGSSIVEGLRLARSAPADTLKLVAALNARDDVLYAEPNYICISRPRPTIHSSQLYGLNLISTQAWDITQGNRNIVVAVIDEDRYQSSRSSRQHLTTQSVRFPIQAIFTATIFTIIQERFWRAHATHVAGTVGAVGNNNTGVAGGTGKSV